MRVIKERKCSCCGELYEPDRRNAWHQRHCCKEGCRKASKAASQHRWLRKAGNRDYFRSVENVARVKEWRAAHPGYWRRKAGGDALQEVKGGQCAEMTKEIGIFGKLSTERSSALQEVKDAQHLVLIGLIAQMTGATLQDDIALVGRNLLRLGQDVVNGVPAHDSKAITLPGPVPAGAKAVQLGGHTAGP